MCGICGTVGMADERVIQQMTRVLAHRGPDGSGFRLFAPDDTVPEDVEAQAVLCFENIKAILGEAGMTLADVVRFTAYVTDRAYFPIYGAVRGRYVEGNAFASTLVIVSGFTRPEFKVEVEAIAAAP